MEQYYQQLLRYLTGRLRDRHLAADITHDAYVRVLEGSESAIEYPQAYLYRTALNLAVDHHRRSSTRRCESLSDIEPDIQEQPFRSPQDSLYLQQRAGLVERALGELSENCRRAFLLRKLEGLGHDEIAERMGISKPMVEKHIVNAMRHCRIRVKEMEYAKLD